MKKGLSVLVGITCVVVIIAMAIISFSIWRFHSYFVTTIPHNAKIEIALAKESAMHKDAFVSVMIANLDPSANYDYFMSDNGHPTVEVTGTITSRQQLEAFCDLAQKYRKENATTDSYFTTSYFKANRLTNSPVYSEWLRRISFRIQLRKVFASDDVKYNHYITGYSEISWTDTDAIRQTVNTQGDFIYDLFDECIRLSWDNQVTTKHMGSDITNE